MDNPMNFIGHKTKEVVGVVEIIDFLNELSHE